MKKLVVVLGFLLLSGLVSACTTDLVYDDEFDDGSVNTEYWINTTGNAVFSETGGYMELSASSGYAYYEYTKNIANSEIDMRLLFSFWGTGTANFTITDGTWGIVCGKQAQKCQAFPNNATSQCNTYAEVSSAGQNYSWEISHNQINLSNNGVLKIQCNNTFLVDNQDIKLKLLAYRSGTSAYGKIKIYDFAQGNQTEYYKLTWYVKDTDTWEGIEDVNVSVSDLYHASAVVPESCMTDVDGKCVFLLDYHCNLSCDDAICFDVNVTDPHDRFNSYKFNDMCIGQEDTEIYSAFAPTSETHKVTVNVLDDVSYLPIENAEFRYKAQINDSIVYHSCTTNASGSCSLILGNGVWWIPQIVLNISGELIEYEYGHESDWLYLTDTDPYFLERSYYVDLGYTVENITVHITDLGEVTEGDYYYISALYEYSDIHIPDGVCTYSSTALYPSSGSLVEYPNQEFYTTNVMIADVSGNQSYTISCYKSGMYSPVSKSDDFFVWESNETATELVLIVAPSGVTVGTHVTFQVKYRTTAEVGIPDAFCNLTLNGTVYSMTEKTYLDGYYYKSYIADTPGSVNYSFSCSKANYQTASSPIINLYVYDEEPPPPPPNHCENGYKDEDETDIDCGGSCPPCGQHKGCIVDSDCISGWCHNGVCTYPSCSDGIRNGDETGIDCGGSCSPCMCFQNWDCASDGSERCVSNECVLETCSVNADCPPLYWYNSIYGYFYQDRECYDGVCRFISENETSGDIAMNIIPLSTVIWNDSNRFVYVSTCEENTNRFIVLTGIPTRKWYFLSDPVHYSPYVTPTSNIIFGSDYESETTGEIIQLCEIPESSDRIYSLLTFYAIGGSANNQMKSIYTLTFRDAFKLVASWEGDDQILLNLSRNGTCFYRNKSTNPWTSINVVESDSILFNSSTNMNYLFMCNNSFGEKITSDYGGGGRMIVVFVADVIIMLFSGLWIAFTGSAFVWYSWYIIPVAILLLFVFPLLIIIFLYSKRMGPSGGSGGE